MRNHKTLYSTYFRKYDIGKEKLEELQRELLGIFLDFKAICDDNGINYMMCGGSALGTVRHQGFIPWDDDLDVMMTRAEYDKFVKAFHEKSPEDYILAEPLSDKDYFCKMPGLYKKGTRLVTAATAGNQKFQMLSIDIFIIENMPASAWKRHIIGIFYDLAYKASSVCADYNYPSPFIEKEAEQNRELKRYYQFRKRLGSLFYHLGGSQFYISICEKLANRKEKTGWYGIPSGIGYEREVFQSDSFVDTTTGCFCGYQVKISCDNDTYLKNLYGNYMKLPPESEREVHSVIDFYVRE